MMSRSFTRKQRVMLIFSLLPLPAANLSADWKHAEDRDWILGRCKGCLEGDQLSASLKSHQRRRYTHLYITWNTSSESPFLFAHLAWLSLHLAFAWVEFYVSHHHFWLHPGIYKACFGSYSVLWSMILNERFCNSNSSNANSLLKGLLWPYAISCKFFIYSLLMLKLRIADWKGKGRNNLPKHTCTYNRVSFTFE